MAQAAYRAYVCHGPNCSKKGCRQLFDTLEREVRELHLEEQVEVLPGLCNKLCDYGPSMIVHPGPTWYCQLTPAAIKEIVQKHFIEGKLAREWLPQDHYFKRDSRRRDRPTRAASYSRSR